MVNVVLVEQVGADIFRRRFQGKRRFGDEMHDSAFAVADGAVAFHPLGDRAAFELVRNLAAMAAAAIDRHHFLRFMAVSGRCPVRHI